VFNTAYVPFNPNQLYSRYKRFDYFTSCLPFVQKGTAVSLPLTGNATVRTNASALITSAAPGMQVRFGDTGAVATGSLAIGTGGGTNPIVESTTAAVGGVHPLYPSNLYADLSTATATTINALRLAFQTQKLLERDARGGTRYTEIVRSHFGVISPDARLQRPEYLGGGSSPINFTPVPQTSATGLTGGTTAKGDLAAFATTLGTHGFSQSFTEHGFVIGFVNIRADLSYQQGMRRLWSRLTRYDHYFPVFAALGEQAVLNQEIYADGSANDVLTFGYNERWAEYRYHPSMITGRFRSTAATPLDVWHLSQKFTTLPLLNSTFMVDATNQVLQRNLAVSTTTDQFYFDAFINKVAARPMPMYSVPGLIDHF